ncbi:hypothetical protein [uncultured Flavobacterium sp.]|uniref:hypothetical protein n=1 Tax=uncultured Flavobacterium sp. TaxID=165435 RepID=UPI002608C8CC|nr:hypothetical protein [uncultured Flavobacterium sp.]
MLLKKTLFVFILNLICLSVKSQGILSVKKIETIEHECDVFLGYDNQFNLYSIKNNTLSKKNSSKTYQYNNINLGKITKVDFQNPLQIVVFYKNFNTIILLDNQLNEIKKIEFNLKPTPITLDAVSLSSQNQVWIYDSISSKIGLYNVNTDALKWISTMLENPIINYESDYTHFYWTDKNLNLYRISIYGAIEKLGIQPLSEKAQLINNTCSLYQLNNQLFYYSAIDQKKYKITIDEKIISNFFFKDGILSIFTQNEITNYKIILP